MANYIIEIEKLKKQIASMALQITALQNEVKQLKNVAFPDIESLLKEGCNANKLLGRTISEGLAPGAALRYDARSNSFVWKK